MPVDYRRIAGPEATVPYDLFIESNKNFGTTGFQEVREDGRKYDEHRKICNLLL